MLGEFEEIEARYGAEKGADLRHACRYLLQNQFIYAGDRGANVPYDMLTDAKFRSTVDGFFDCLGLKIHREPTEQWVGVLPDPEDVKSLPKLSLAETVMILTLAAQWQEQVDQGNVEERAVVVTTLNDLYERYREMNQGVTATMSTAAFEAGLDVAKDRGLVWKGELDPEADDKEVRIRPMIKLVAGADALRRIEEFVRTEERDASIARRIAMRADTKVDEPTEDREPGFDAEFAQEGTA